MTPPLWTAIVGLLAAIIGGFIQGLLTSGRERKSFQLALARDNYVLFLQSVAGMAKNPNEGEDRKRYTQMSIEAVGRILLLGSTEVVEALKIHQLNGRLDSTRKYEDFGRLVAAMRKDIGGGDMPAFESIVRHILFEGHS